MAEVVAAQADADRLNAAGAAEARSQAVKADAEVLKAALDSSKTTRGLAARMDDLVTRLKRRRFKSSSSLVKETLDLLQLLVNAKNWSGAREMLQAVRAFGRRLVRARPVELVVGNVFRHVIHMVKEEYFIMLQSTQDKALSEAAVTGEVVNELDPKGDILPNRDLGIRIEDMAEIPDWNVRSAAANVIADTVAELENIMEPISSQAPDHIHAHETILVYGDSGSVLGFLKAARRQREFRVIVAEAAPEFGGQRMARKLSTADPAHPGDLAISTMVIPDSNIFAIMPRVTKVIVGARAVMANGGLIAEAGMHMVALAARQHAVPLMCVTGLYKLCPLYPYDRDSFIDLKSPGPTLPYAKLGEFSDRIQVLTPSCDYVPPGLVDVLITNNGAHQPSYVYRLLYEQYDTNAEEDLLL
ncbi:Translation initiation factor eIF-2B subunit beta [Hondaea fermentalgiana]|uniref:Translation initiation factor eIF2B subunit beta n=1 Tax=Hondaea fermentalgiana TaxID=2315210 RepID=A0A2R5G6F8_9STRA|nr:Translation initiation factor eIF-2B subunit beta [Hondaea fermentalgiana]|eukprot:GBG26626.1 Translation initiation factor eIF-2B subunit beta [Hondaea fermentalgiana]